MRRAIWFLIVVWLVLILTACNGQKWCAKRFPPETITRIDSVIETEYRDTLVMVQGEVIRDTFRVECDSTGQVVITGGNGEVRYVYRNKYLTVSAKCRDTAIVIPRYKQVVKVTADHSKVVHIPDMYIPWWAELLSWVGGISLLYLAGRAGIRWFMKSV